MAFVKIWVQPARFAGIHVDVYDRERPGISSRFEIDELNAALNKCRAETIKYRSATIQELDLITRQVQREIEIELARRERPLVDVLARLESHRLLQ